MAARLANAAGLVGRLLGSSASAQLGALEPGGPLSGARCNPGRRGVLAMAVVTALTVLVAGGWVLAARPHPMLAANSAPAGSSASSAGSSTVPLVPGGSLKSPRTGPSGSAAPAGGSTLLVVDVAGKVRRPGVYRLPAGSRVDDAVRAAGGLLSGVDPVTVNLARKLVDGEQVLVGLAAASAGGPGGSAAPGGPGATTPTGTAGPLDLNSATLAQLDGLPGVGPVLAQRILDWRTAHGRFDSVDQLRGVSGIGDSKYADLKSLVTLG
ncbi:MAG: competence protein ComEA [Pseudonocardiales bacterium]|nr:competence protein ComEA [Pseudonocardiales bacterium]